MNRISTYDDTGRILLMTDPPPSGPKAFHDLLKAEHPEITITIAMDLWAKYRGFDGRQHPTHDVETGAALRGTSTRR